MPQKSAESCASYRYTGAHGRNAWPVCVLHLVVVEEQDLAAEPGQGIVAVAAPANPPLRDHAAEQDLGRRAAFGQAGADVAIMERRARLREQRQHPVRFLQGRRGRWGGVPFVIVCCVIGCSLSWWWWLKRHLVVGIRVKPCVTLGTIRLGLASPENRYAVSHGPGDSTAPQG